MIRSDSIYRTIFDDRPRADDLGWAVRNVVSGWSWKACGVRNRQTGRLIIAGHHSSRRVVRSEAQPAQSARPGDSFIKVQRRRRSHDGRRIVQIKQHGSGVTRRNEELRAGIVLRKIQGSRGGRGRSRESFKPLFPLWADGCSREFGVRPGAPFPEVVSIVASVLCGSLSPSGPILICKVTRFCGF